MLYRYVMGYVSEEDFDTYQKKIADANSDGSVNGTDTNMLFRYVMGYITSL